MALLNAVKEAVVDLIMASHPGSWGLTEMRQSVCWPFSNRDLINKARTSKPCIEIGKNLKPLKQGILQLILQLQIVLQIPNDQCC